MVGDFQRNLIEKTTYRAYGSQRDSYRNSNYLYPTFIVPKYCHNNNGVDFYEHQEPARKVLHFFSSSIFYVYRIVMWLLRKIFRVRVCQHALVSCIIILIFILLSYVYEGDQLELEKVKPDVKDTGAINSDTNSQHVPKALRVYIEEPLPVDKKEPPLQVDIAIEEPLHRVDIKEPLHQEPLQEAGDTNRQQIKQVAKPETNRTKPSVPEVPVYDTEAKCGNKDPCQKSHFAYHVKSGNKKLEKPYVCVDGREIMRQQDMDRGMNIVHIKDAAHMQKITTQVFDLYDEGSSRLENFLENVEDRQIIIVASYDDAEHQLSDKAKKMFMDEFYSKEIYRLNYRGQWVFIGQKGKPLDGENEKVNLFEKKPKVSWADQVEIQGCLKVDDKAKPKPISEWLGASCDVETPCGEDSIAMHVESGDFHAGRKTLPRVCIGDKIVLGNHKIGKEEPASRGLNFVVYDPIDKEVVKIGRFDTYGSDSADRDAATFLKSVKDGHLVIGTVFDEATNKMSYDTKGVIQSLGSSQIYALDYREMWVFVGQKGIDGTSPFERVGAKTPSSWGAKADIIDCIPKIIKGANEKVANSKKRDKFCENYIGYPELCLDGNSTQAMYPLPLDDPSLSLNEAYSTPIVVIPGTDLHALERCLASLLAVPGIRTNNVLVVLEGSFSEPNDLVSLYGFRSEYIKSSADYQRTFMNGLERGLSAFPGKEYIIVLEEYLEVTPDFLHYFGQTLHLLDKDSTILTVSAWNQNGFKDTSGDQHLLYRTEDFPGFGWVLRRKLFEKDMKNTTSGCTKQPTWRGWFLDNGIRKGRHSVVPDVSRVKRIKKEGFYTEKSFMDAYLDNRKASSGYLSEPREVYKLVNDQYDKELDRLVKESIAVEEAELSTCFKDGALKLQHEPNKGQIYAVYFQQNSAADTHLLRQLATCFGLFEFEDSHIRGMHKGLLRFTRHGNQYMLISTQSPYYEHRESKRDIVLPVIGQKSKQIDTSER